MDNIQKDEEDFNLIDFDLKKSQEKESLINDKQETVKPVFQKVGNQNIELKQVNSIDELSEETKAKIKNLFKPAMKEELKNLIQNVDSQKEIMFDTKNEKSAFGKLSSKDQDVLKEKMAEWNVPQELSNLNASVILSWLNKTIKENN